jgi:hypothetical protein
MFVVCCKNSFKTFIKNMPKKLRSNYHHVTVEEWNDFISKIKIPVTLTMKQKDDINIENKNDKKVKERCD